MSYDRYPRGKKKVQTEVEIKCTDCTKMVCRYRKEGYGPIGEMVINSILDDYKLKNTKQLECLECGKVLGKRITISKGEQKKEFFKIYPGSVFYKVIKK